VAVMNKTSKRERSQCLGEEPEESRSERRKTNDLLHYWTI